MTSKKNLILITMLVLASGMAFLQVTLNINGELVSASTEALWSLLFIVLSIFWVYYDSNRGDFKKPFDFGLIIYIFWPIALPWYLLATRKLDGLLTLCGFIFIWCGPWVAGLIAYEYFS